MTEPLVNLPIVAFAFWGASAFLIVYCALLLSIRIRRKHYQQKSLVDRINKLLPQTQCGQCGYEGCRPYARAMSQGVPANRCPPGGNQTIVKLSNLLNRVPMKLDPANGTLTPFKVAVIREDECIGCTKCIVACPVDAILGGPKSMHTVIEKECTGCDLCVEPCPVDCIDMIEVSSPNKEKWKLPSIINSPLHALEYE